MNEAFAQEQPFAGTVSGEVGSKPYAGGFAEKGGASHDAIRGSKARPCPSGRRYRGGGAGTGAGVPP